jgi:hypothetical protein
MRKCCQFFTGASRHPNSVPNSGPHASSAQAFPHSFHRSAPFQPRRMMLAKPALSATSTDQPMPWPLLPGPPQPLSIPAASISPALVRLSDSTMHVSASMSNRARYCLDADETIMGHLTQQCQNVWSTKPKPSAPNQALLTPAIAPLSSALPSIEVYIRIYPISKLHTDDTGRFPVKARSGNQYVMIAYYADGNLILQQAFKSKSNTHRIAAYNAIMTHLAARGLSVDLQILDNKAIAAYKHAITFTWQAKFQLVPPDMHRRNRAEQAIRTFKAHFLSILAGVDPTFPPYLWDLLLPQAELTLNLL